MAGYQYNRRKGSNGAVARRKKRRAAEEELARKVGPQPREYAGLLRRFVGKAGKSIIKLFS